ncbi:acyl-CoA dehydrogenase family protein [Actinomadura rugatobispora]|uniref:Acyl-CoA dehydrogenase family protein n=1 Tax=Actinomadura rugatobispora TaxID=1994 RepID=A0ABW0ZTX6_9ACTN|nr:acyl-CoA dehydrogenase family protein [Actinomadura rugatobispora]
MILDFTPDQRLFHSTTKDFLERTAPVAAVRELADSGGGFDRDWWRRGAELGWTALLVPEELGGGSVSGSPVTELTIVAEEMGRACAPGPLTTTSAVLAGLARAGDRFAAAIEAIMSGETVASWAFYRPGRGLSLDHASLSARAEPDGEGYRLSGEVDRVESGDQAGVFLVTAGSPGGPVQLLVPADSPGVTVTPTWTLDVVRRTARVGFADVAVPPDAVVQRGAEAAAAVEAQLQIAAALAAAEMAGAADRTFEFTVQWMFDRYTFGRPLASYQALKHRMADNKTWLEACHATVSAAARALDDDPAEAAEAVSAAKSFVGAKAPVIIQDCVQMHGGIGVTWEHDIHLYLRRATLDRALYGTPEEHRRRITDLLDRRAA